FDRVLVGQVVRPLDGVEDVPLPVIFFMVAERSADAALGRARVRAGRVELADDRGVDTARGVECSHQPGAAPADDDSIILVCLHGRYSLFLRGAQKARQSGRWCPA